MKKNIDRADYHDQVSLEAVFLGKKIVGLTRESSEEALIELSDGTSYRMMSNEGCGGCSNGWYELTQLATAEGVADNIITAVKVEHEDGTTHEDVFKLFIFAEHRQLALAEYEGADNGYYGMGFTLRLVK